MSIQNVRGFLPGESALPDEVVTRALVRDVDLGAVVPGERAGVMALITLDNGLDHTRPSTFGHDDFPTVTVTPLTPQTHTYSGVLPIVKIRFGMMPTDDLTVNDVAEEVRLAASCVETRLEATPKSASVATREGNTWQ